MAYYTPTWLAVVGVLASICASVQLPMFGFLLSKMVFVLMISYDDPQFAIQRDFWIIMFGVLCTGIFTFTFI